MPTPLIYWNTDTGAVSLYLSTLSPLQIASDRGDQALQVVLVQGTPAAPYLPAGDQNVGIVVRDPLNLKAGCLAGPTVLTRGANAGAGFAGTTSTDTTFTRGLMRVDPDDAASELPTFAASARFYLTPTAAGAGNVESTEFAWQVGPDYYRPLQPPADVIETYPPADQVDTIAARNAAIAAAIDTSAAPIQPFAAFLANDYKFVLSGSQESPANGYQNQIYISNQGITSVDAGYLTAMLTANRYLAGSVLDIEADGNALTQAGTDAWVAAIGAFCAANSCAVNYDISGGTSAAPTPTTPHKDEIFILDFRGIFPAKAAGTFTLAWNDSFDPGSTGATYTVDPTQPLSAMGSGNVCISDATTAQQVAAAFVASNNPGGVANGSATAADNGNGTVTFTVAAEQYYPISATNGGGITYAETQAGVAEAVLGIEQVQAQGGYIQTN